MALEVPAMPLLLATVTDAERLGFNSIIAPNATLLLSTLTRLLSMGPPTRTVTSTHGPKLNPLANKVSKFGMGTSATVGAMSVEVVIASGVITTEGRHVPCLFRRRRKKSRRKMKRKTKRLTTQQSWLVIVSDGNHCQWKFEADIVCDEYWSD